MFVAVARIDYEGERIIGVFGSEELARDGIKTFRTTDDLVEADDLYDEYRIYEFSLDRTVTCDERLGPIFVTRTYDED